MPSCDICFLTTVHYAGDGRICQKQARALAGAGYGVTVIGRPDSRAAPPPGVTLQFLPAASGRLRRLLASPALLRRALRTGARVFAVHDPELLLLAALLHLGWGRRVVYDIHEDIPAQIGMKEWLPPASRRAVAWAYRAVEGILLRAIDGVVLAESSYETGYRGRRQVTVLNYPRTDDDGPAPAADGQGPLVVYLGTITERRGLFHMLEVARRVLGQVPAARFRFVGPVAIAAEQRAARDFVARHGLADRVLFTGRLTPPEAQAAIAGARVGLALLRPEPNYVHSLPTKLFEYMLAGVPVVCSDVPLWRGIVESADCGAAVDPLDPEASAAAVLALLRDEARARRLGANGRRAVLERYSWDSQASRLVAFYRDLAGPPVAGPASTSS